MTKKKQYPSIKLSFPERKDTKSVRDNLAEVAQTLGYVSTYHKTVKRGSISLMLLAIARGDAKVVKSDK